MALVDITAFFSHKLIAKWQYFTKQASGNASRRDSNWQVSTRSRDVKDGKLDQITREPEQVKAFRDTWADGIHSYLTYLRDRMTAMRDLLTESGSIFVQIGDENVHRVRALMDEVFGEENFCALIQVQKTGGQASTLLATTVDFIIWYGKKKALIKYRQLFIDRKQGHTSLDLYDQVLTNSGQRRRLTKNEIQNRSQVTEGIFCREQSLISSGLSTSDQIVSIHGRKFSPRGNSHWKTTVAGIKRLDCAGRVGVGPSTISYIRTVADFPIIPIHDRWDGLQIGQGLNYIVETSPRVVERCILMATDPGDLVLDPTCGSGTTAYVAEQWGRRWITLDTSRVSLALARARLMGSRYPYYHLADSAEGRDKEADITGKIQPDTPTHGDIRQGFVYERAPHIMLKTIANNAEIDVIWDNYQQKLEPIRKELNEVLGTNWEEWEIPRDLSAVFGKTTETKESISPSVGEKAAGGIKRTTTASTYSSTPKADRLHAEWWELRITRQQEIDKSIAKKADVEYLYNRPYEDKSKVRVAGPFTVESLSPVGLGWHQLALVAGPFTVESLSPHQVIPADEEELSDLLDTGERVRKDAPLNDFTQMVLENLKSAGVHQATKDDRISFMTIDGWPGNYIAAEGRYQEGESEKRAAIFIGPEFGTVTRADLTAAAREALYARFDTLIACGFNFEAHTSELSKLGPLPILKAKMNPDLHMSDELKNTGQGNLFVVFGEPDIEWTFDEDGKIIVEVLGIDVFDPKTGEVRASGKDDIAAWFIDTDYNEESFFVRPATGRFAVKVINHFGDEVMKVFGV